ncbi:MAG TPA: porin [Burkholderiales bacterium]|nr:porin [Burkholderiales bacterium]
MNKKILALTLSTASAVAFADVTLYGKLAVGIENDQFPNSSLSNANSVQDYGSYFGIRGSDPVYGETAAIWQVETFLDLVSGQAYYNSSNGGLMLRNPNAGLPGGRVTSEKNVLATSESYLGLQGVWGRLQLGNLSNYMRSRMNAIDMFNYGNGANGLTLTSRTTYVLPVSVAYYSPTWGGFSFGGVYSFNNSGQPGIGGIAGGSTFGGGLNGYYSGGVYSLGMGWGMDNFNLQLGSQIWQNVGNYIIGNNSNATGCSSVTSTGQCITTPGTTYSNAYVGKLEFSYNDPDSMIIGAGFQITDGLGWGSWANSGGSFNNFIYNPGTQIGGLNSNQYQTQEAFASFGWHINSWTPKIGYAHGNNMMTGGTVQNLIWGNANQIADSGYDQVAAELDWNITPRTIAFIGAGRIWWGNTVQNIAFGATGSVVNGTNQYQNNNQTVALGFSHTF